MIPALIVILAAIVASYVAWRYGPLKAFLNVYLPLLIFIPFTNGVTTHGVFISPGVAASLPIVFLMFFRPEVQVKWRWTDLILMLFMVESFYGEFRVAHDFSFAGADAVGTLIVILPNYLMGRYLLEMKDARVPVLKRLVFMLFLVSCLSVYEYRMGTNPFVLVFSRIFGIPFYFLQQFRWGFARTAGPFGHAILAGIVLIAGLLFQLWLTSNGHWEKKMRLPSWLGAMRLPGKKSTLITLGLLAGVWMTQSRGPWMGGALGFVLFWGSRARRIRRGITKAVILSVVAFAAFYIATDKYTDPGSGTMSSDQENAVYRRVLLTNYMPIVEAGGWFGMGRYFPTVGGQGSIDNFYLLTALLSGYAGFWLIVLLIALTCLRLLHTAWVCRDREDAAFALCLLAIIAGTAVTLTTVWLGDQAFALFFLVCGWAQAVKPRRASATAPELAAQSQPIQQRFAYRRVFS